MDFSQTDHLKAYGVVYRSLEAGIECEWLLNYRGGSFLIYDGIQSEKDCRINGVYYENINMDQVNQIRKIIEKSNMASIKLEVAPKIAVYVPPNREPWDDAVRLVLEYAGIPYETVWDEEVLKGELSKYDWLHLHHEDFTGQYGKFYASYRNTDWYKEEVRMNEEMAKKLGFKKVSQLKKAVAMKIKEYIFNGGFVFAMCSATETIDVALASINTDIVPSVFDGDPVDRDYKDKLDFNNTLAFQNFSVITDPFYYGHSTIDTYEDAINRGEGVFFSLFDFSAKYDPVPCMLVQNHTGIVKEFLGQTVGFHKKVIKPEITVLGEIEGTDEVKYLHGNLGKGSFTFLGGHDPEDYAHRIGDPPTDLSLHRNSPGYRLILNNILFPAAEKKKIKT